MPQATSPDRVRLLTLLAAHRAVVSQVDLPVVLRTIVEIARELLGARYAALGVLDPTGTELEQFIHAGMDAETVARIGRLPTGGGLLGAVLTADMPLRSDDVTSDTRSGPLPAGHPTLHTFLGAPLRMGELTYGNLYLADSLAGVFTDDDEEVLIGLAATAGIAIANARRLHEAQQRQNWLEASAVVTRQLLSEDGEDPLRLIARTVAELAGGDLVTVILPTPDGSRLLVEVAVGERAADLTAMPVPFAQSVAGRVMRTGVAELITDVERPDDVHVHSTLAGGYGPAMALPLVGGSGVARGVLTVGRQAGRTPFTAAEAQMATMFAGHAAVALELADAQADQERVALLEDRDRIARDLHDHVIQRLFGAGLRLQRLAIEAGPGELADRLASQTDDIDAVIRQIRTTIFRLRGPVAGGGSLREQVLKIVADLRPALGFVPAVAFDGPVDTIIDETVGADLLAAVREALTNVARHARASEAAVELTVLDGQATLDVRDDGIGIGAATRRSGLANLARRAAGLGGSFDVDPAGLGTHVRLVVPARAPLPT